MTRLYVVFLILMMPLAAQAAQEKPAQIEKLDAAGEALIKDLTPDQAQQFMAIRTGHGTLRAVEDVRDTLARGVASCTTAQPDLAQDLKTAWGNWQKGVAPALRAGHKRLGELVTHQKFSPPKKMRDYLKSFDAVIKSRQSAGVEVPVSTQEACQDMMKQLDATGEMMPQVINETLGLSKK